MAEDSRKIIDTNRAQLGLLTLKDLKSEELTEDEQKNRAAQIAGVYETLKEEVQDAINAQIRHAILSTENWEQVLIARGAINMGYLMMERFDTLKAQHDERNAPKEDFDPHSPI